MLNKKLKQIKEYYKILTWIYVKNNRKVPKYINDVLDLIEYVEDKKK